MLTFIRLPPAAVSPCARRAALLGALLLMTPFVAAQAKPAIRGPFTFDCVGDAPETLTLTLVGKSRARISRNGETVLATQSVSADGALYRARDVEFWNKGDDAVAQWREIKLKCVRRR